MYFLLLQSLLFLDQFTLLGKKSDVYVLLKVLKYCTGSSAKSYQCKYAIDDKLHNNNQEQIDLCDAIREVIQFASLRGKFSSVHEDLMAEGVSRVEVTKSGFLFLMDKGGCNHVLVIILQKHCASKLSSRRQDGSSESSD